MRCPHNFKWQLVEWASRYYKLPKAKFNKMSKKQLYWIWFNPDKYKVS